MQIRSIDLPDELLQAARDGQLVVFVGAGASRDDPSGLPDFAKLVTRIGRRADSRPKKADLRRPDVFLGRLDDEKVDVHRLVHEAINLPKSEPNRLHHAIIDVARTHGPIRVVTTNYDLHLTTAARSRGLEPQVFEAPALPVGDDFTGIVHLHGALTQDPARLVVTDVDFGRAYLREAWAARFLERMFSSFTVLFIGYSHGDVVMQYLARSLDRHGRRYVLTHEANRAEWRSLGLTPVTYEATGGSHHALPGALERWAELTAMGRTEHRTLITDIVAGDPPTIPDEAAYIEEAFGHPERVRYFAGAARGASWLTWAATRPEFGALFDDGSQADPEVTQTIAAWVVSHYVLDPGHTAQALRLLGNRMWSPALWEAITFGLFAHEGPLPTPITPWVPLVLSQVPTARRDTLDMLMFENDKWGEHPDLLLLLWEHRTRPIPQAGLSYGHDTSLPGFDIDLAGEEYWLNETWTKLLRPRLSELAGPLLDITGNQLAAADRLYRALNPGAAYGPRGFAWRAIETSDDYHSQEGLDVLIEAARESLEFQLEHQPKRATTVLDDWLSSDVDILRRLAVHGWRLRTDRTADQKLSAATDADRLYDDAVRHELRLLLTEHLPQADEATVRLVVARAVQGPSSANVTDDGDDIQRATSPVLARYYLLDRLRSAFPTVTPLAEAFAELQRVHPELRARGVDGPALVVEASYPQREPLSADELHQLLSTDPHEAATQLTAYADQPVSFFGGPTWRGTLSAVRACVEAHPEDGLRLSAAIAPSPDEAGAQLRQTVIHAWADATIDEELAGEILVELARVDLDHVLTAVTSMLAGPGRGRPGPSWAGLPAARGLATRLWPDRDVPGNVNAAGDLMIEAINHPAGELAEFWTLAVQHDWREQQGTWEGIRGDTQLGLEKIVSDPGRAGVLGRSVLLAQLRFYQRADADWTAQNLLPLLDWSRSVDEAPGNWQVFLEHGRPDEELLEAGLLPHYLATASHLSEFSKDRMEWKLGDHLAQVALFTSVTPRTWLSRFVRVASEETRCAWVRRVSHHLKDMPPEHATMQWKRWIQRYWNDRVQSIPLPLTSAEGAAMANWIPHLPEQRSEAAALFIQGPAAIGQRDSLLYALSKADLAPDAEAWLNVVTHLLAGTDERQYAIGHSLATIVRKLRGAAPGLDLGPLIEHAMRLRCADAPEW
ncbi:DUF4020 domain-containing protein [Nocardioides bruguierae]|uniref:DUF4020 domain-containing protein n=1 Tax=Nocardioides bruguierae TaxID=2945102 RepID=UPI002022276F|nr:DUF4020 domain-containing protein [Nocardioides bruguierae]MCL8027346.1 DUF4020 domain-containing protein [Nocardioides bruguierae]